VGAAAAAAETAAAGGGAKGGGDEALSDAAELEGVVTILMPAAAGKRLLASFMDNGCVLHL
jgi:hypothetical protein